LPKVLPGFAIVRPISTRSAQVRSAGGALYFAKWLPSRLAHEPEARACLKRESDILQALKHPHGMAGTVSNLISFLQAEEVLVTEWRTATDPATWVRPCQAERERALAAALLAVQAIHDAHDAAGRLEIVHGDISPSNLLFCGKQTTIVDFELASMRAVGPPRDGSVRGTLAYLAPEVARGEAPTQASDLFALGASLYERFIGQRLRTAAGPALLLCVAEKPPDLAALNALGRAGTVVAQLLASAPEARPASARDALRLLS
jgi:eukaryotic-like serine/threonine-protein kinase